MRRNNRTLFTKDVLRKQTLSAMCFVDLNVSSYKNNSMNRVAVFIQTDKKEWTFGSTSDKNMGGHFQKERLGVGAF